MLPLGPSARGIGTSQRLEPTGIRPALAVTEEWDLPYLSWLGASTDFDRPRALVLNMLWDN